ncbi:PAS domain S-box protein [Maribacter sp. HTCC2170]|uniref:PAS domain-containing sensor histidine kinase n=1 Tax=Maribacter sp. (strain HTCC2170 / KCCM 42371) TaxID=313603 RepID=UPI00006BD308|nr:PAS domain S-box protein [Maribacter sp. HTCC2170]EAR02320.1 multi-sensor signal transduction histidine kinase [Maribacter sp. HTCC2170]
MDSKEVILLKKALDRQKKARIQAEKILENKSKELYDVTHHLKLTNSKLENLLSEKTSELDGVFINIIDPYVVMDLKFNVINMNISAKDFLGYDHTKEHINLANLVHKDYLQYTTTSFKSLLEVGILKNYKAKIIVKDGSEKYVQINSSLIYNKERKPIAAQGIIRDVTHEMEINHLLAEQKRQLNIIIENSPLSVVLTVDGKVIKANKTFTDLLGYSEAELKNISVKDISTPEENEKSIRLMELMNSGELDNFSIIKGYVRKDGTRLLAKTSVNAVKDDDGEVEYQVAMIEDITEQRNLELQKERLMKELEASNQGLQEYAHIVSHDLKSPLRSISALATWLSEDYEEVLDENGVFNLQQIQEKIAGMDKLIDGILKYSSIDQDSLENIPVDINTVINEIREIIFIPENVDVVIMNTLPVINADKTKIHQLFQNLMANAVVNIEREDGLVQISSKEYDDHWQFSIKDNGVGIPKEYHEKIFKIFQSIGSGGRSTGIGLSIVKKIIDLYEGRIWLESSVGEGTTFYFTIKK